jgi:hypothetical protein
VDLEISVPVINPPADQLRLHSNVMARRLLFVACLVMALYESFHFNDYARPLSFTYVDLCRFAGSQATQPAFALNLGLNAVEYLKQKTLDAILPKCSLHCPYSSV